MPGVTDITVLKRSLDGEVTWQYEGRVLKRDTNRIVLEAFFNRDDMAFMDVILKRDDRFVETFYNDRWYNVFEIYDRDEGKFKGWYCNIGYPAVLEKDSVSYIDLALDLWVAADGTHSFQFRAPDIAGNLTETPIQSVQVDTIPPAIDMPASWNLGQIAPFYLQDEGSGLGKLRVVIVEANERFPKVFWQEGLAGQKYKGEIDWNGRFKGGILALVGRSGWDHRSDPVRVCGWVWSQAVGGMDLGETFCQIRR